MRVADAQRRFVDARSHAHGNAGIVEFVDTCSLYSTMGDMITAFDIEIEKGLPCPPF